jgi:hypothetical protein
MRGGISMDLGAGELYFVREIDPKTKKFSRFVKIGLVHEKEGRSSLDRLSEHQTGNPRVLSLPESNYFMSPAINRVEAMMHKVFARNRVSGEWFEFETEKDVAAAIRKGKQLAAEVQVQIPTFTKANKLGQSLDNGKTIAARLQADVLIGSIAVARAKKRYLSEISKGISEKLASAISAGVSVQGAAELVSVNRRGKFDIDTFKVDEPKTYKKFSVISTVLKGSFLPKVKKLDLGDLDETFQKMVKQLGTTVEKAKHNDYRVLNEVQLVLTDEIAVADWDEEFALAELKIECGRNRAIEGLCTWKREMVEKTTFDESAFKLKNPALYEKYVKQSTGSSYLRVSKRRIS